MMTLTIEDLTSIKKLVSSRLESFNYGTDNLERQADNDMHEVMDFLIENPQVANEVKDFCDKDNGFMWSNNSSALVLQKEISKVNSGHSGCSMALTCRHIQKHLLKYADTKSELEFSYYAREISVTPEEASEHVYKLMAAAPFLDYDHSNVNHEEKPVSIDGAGKLIPTYNDMDDNNKKATDVLVAKGPMAAIKSMFTKEDGTQRSYSAMRELYG